MSDIPRFLMCQPDFYQVDYVINVWMEGNVDRSSPERAAQQWHELARVLRGHAEVELVCPERGWPDMVFTANAGLVLGKNAVVSRFFHPERQGEEPFFKAWFEKAGFTVYELPEDLPFEGAGDALLDREGRWLWAGYGPRSELDAHPLVAKWLGIEVLSLRLIDKRFYHLDTCFCPLAGGYLLYYPAAFDAYSNQLIEKRVPAARRFAVPETDAVNFVCNAVNVGSKLIVNKASEATRAWLGAAGFEVIETPLTEFMKAGGAAKCLTLRLDEAERADTRARAAVETREFRLEGHLLDSGLLDKALDLIVDGAGSFQILEFNLGKQRQSISNARLKVSAPSDDALESIMGQLIVLGADRADGAGGSARLETVTQAGVAPADFCVTTIYPTEVQTSRGWVRVEGQRMDGVIVVDEEGRAGCRLIRDLKVGERIVTGVDGIRLPRKTEARDSNTIEASGVAAEEFGFMGAGVSSERRVELVVEQIAWELRRIRDQGGKVVVVAGPVVIHTGGGEHLARLIREGYVHVLLGGNAIAVHDMEQNLLGTSLGMDMKRGVSVHGGHRHHLKVINTVRGHGGIAQTVAAGELRGGVMYECVRNNVPFSLAGSIRDDGPLPDTVMDLIQAQADYARLIQGADMILMLSSMLHSIGVGNMTPAGVKLVCVDINPAVVTKLADRGSVESVGVVTDVGLFLSLLVSQLGKLNSVYAAA